MDSCHILCLKQSRLNDVRVDCGSANGRTWCTPTLTNPGETRCSSDLFRACTPSIGTAMRRRSTPYRLRKHHLHRAATAARADSAMGVFGVQNCEWKGMAVYSKKQKLRRIANTFESRLAWGRQLRSPASHSVEDRGRNSCARATSDR